MQGDWNRNVEALIFFNEEYWYLLKVSIETANSFRVGVGED